MADRDRHTRAGARRGSRTRLRFAADDRLLALVRGGDATAFEILYDRHVRELLSFCRYMLGSPADAEDAVQSTFASAHRALLADDREIELRPWLFAIARNACLSILRRRRPEAEIAEGWASGEDPVAQVEQREDVRQVLATLLELPETQRTALVLSELHGFSQTEIATLLGVRPEQVKSYVYQARTNLISEREARGADCRVIQQELILARGPALLKSRLRRHLRSCSDCREYAAEVARQRHHLGILLPVAPLLALKRRAVHAVLGRIPSSGAFSGGGGGGPAASTTLELSGGGASALMVKLLVGVVCLGAGTGAATLVAGVPGTAARPTAPRPNGHEVVRSRLASFVVAAASQPQRAALQPAGASPDQRAGPVVSCPRPLTSTRKRRQAAPQLARWSRSRPAPTAGFPPLAAPRAKPHGGGSGGLGKSEEAHGKSDEPRGRSEEPHGKEVAPGNGEEPHGRSEEAPGKEEPHGKSEQVHGKSEEAHGGEAAHGKSEEAPGKEEAHAKSEESHGKSEEAGQGRTARRRLESHGKGKGNAE